MKFAVFSHFFKEYDSNSRHAPGTLCFQNANRQSGTSFHPCVRHVTVKIVTNSVTASLENETDKRVESYEERRPSRCNN